MSMDIPDEYRNWHDFHSSLGIYSQRFREICQSFKPHRSKSKNEVKIKTPQTSFFPRCFLSATSYRSGKKAAENQGPIGRKCPEAQVWVFSMRETSCLSLIPAPLTSFWMQNVSFSELRSVTLPSFI